MNDRKINQTENFLLIDVLLFKFWQDQLNVVDFCID